MSEITEEKNVPETPAITTPPITIEAENTWLDNAKTNIGNFLNSWKVRAGLGISALVGIFIFVFFWQHTIAVIGMKSWAARSGAKPIECMIRDTNDDKYVSCSALLEQQVVPLECGASILNLGCRVNYGAATPNLRLIQPQAPALRSGL